MILQRGHSPGETHALAAPLDLLDRGRTGCEAHTTCSPVDTSRQGHIAVVTHRWSALPAISPWGQPGPVPLRRLAPGGHRG